MEYGSPAPMVAFVLAVVSGTLLATGKYFGGAIAGVLGILLFGLYRWGREKGEDDRHTLW